LPVTVATAERSFSKLRLIKTYLSSTMQNDRVSGLVVLSIIENAEAQKSDVGKIIDDFASRVEIKHGGDFDVNRDCLVFIKYKQLLTLNVCCTLYWPIHCADCIFMQ